MKFYEINCEWISAVVPQLQSFIPADFDVSLQQKSQSDDKYISLSDANTSLKGDLNSDVFCDTSSFDIFFGSERVLEDSFHSLQDSFHDQIRVTTDGVSVPRPYRTKSNQEIPKSPSLLLEMADSHREVLFENLFSIPHATDSAVTAKPPYRNLIIFGSLMMLPVMKFLTENKKSPWVSITVVEDDPRQLQAALMLFEMPRFVELCKSYSVSLTFHIDREFVNLQNLLFGQISRINPTVLFGWQTLRSPLRTPALVKLHSWLHAPEGAAQYVLGILGFTTDEINQTQQALWNALSSTRMQVLRKNILTSDTPVVLTASGPSLIDNLSWIKNHRENINLVAAGSSLGTLLKNNIRPDAVVFLERAAEVHQDLCDLLAEGFSLEGISAFLSSTIDPRIPVLFDNVVFFHRPSAAATCLFPEDDESVLPICGPHVINAALESILSLGSREVLLIGADFSARKRSVPRAVDALGDSARSLTIPVSGNKGRTVFSDPELIHTSNLLKHVVETTPDCHVYRLGEGMETKGLESVIPSDELSSKFTSSPGALKSSLTNSHISSFSLDDCDLLFDKLRTELELWRASTKSCTKASNGWSRSIPDNIVPFLQRMNIDDRRERKMLNRLLSPSLFYSLLLLHDSENHNNYSYGKALSAFEASVDQMHDLIMCWLSTMESWFKFKQLPMWSPDWLKSCYQREIS